MKRLLSIIGVALLGTVTHAQTNVPPQTGGTFFNSVSGYFTSFNTNLDDSVAKARGELATGADSLQGGNVSLANSLRLSYNLYQPSNSPTRVGVETVIRNSGVSGTLVSGQVGPQFRFIVHDTTLTLYADPSYTLDPVTHTTAKGKVVKDNAFGAEIGIRVQKALTEHTFAGTGIGAQLPKNQQVFQVFAGFTF